MDDLLQSLQVPPATWLLIAAPLILFTLFGLLHLLRFLVSPRRVAQDLLLALYSPLVGLLLSQLAALLLAPAAILGRPLLHQPAAAKSDRRPSPAPPPAAPRRARADDWPPECGRGETDRIAILFAGGAKARACARALKKREKRRH